jgi:sec-independent protein translocase protein TatA
MLIVVAIVALLFGGSQIPKFARSLGTARKEFERGLHDDAPEPEKASKSD